MEPSETAPDPARLPPDATPAPTEDEPIEEVLWRFAEENGWLDKPRPPLIPRPPEPKSIHQMTPEEMHESLPVHLRRQRPDGTYVVMGVISHMQRDLEYLTQGKRAATYPEVDEALGYALLAEGLAPRWLSAPDAVQWWRAGGSEVLSEARPVSTSVRQSTDEAAPDVMHVRDDMSDGPSIDMNAMVIDDEVDQGQSGTDASVPSSQAQAGSAPASPPVTPATIAPAAGGATGNQAAAAQPTRPEQAPAKPIVRQPSTGTKRTSINNVQNRITGLYLPQNDLILALQNGLLSTLEADRNPGGGGIVNDEQHEKAGRAAQKSKPIANVDVAADADAIAFVNAIASNLSAASTKDKNRKLEKHIMVEWDSISGKYVVTGIKIIPARGGNVGDLKPTLPDNLAILGKSRPRAFVIHTHVVGNGFGERPGPGDGNVVKSWLIPNFVIEDNASKPMVYQVIMNQGKEKKKGGGRKDPRIRVVKISGDGTAQNLSTYEGMPE